MDQWLGERDSEQTCVCSRTGVSNGPGDSYPAAERLENVSVRGPLSVKRTLSAADKVSNEQRYVFILAVESLFKI